MKLWFVEDDYNSADETIHDLKRSFSDIELFYIETESGFCDYLERVQEESRPDLVIMDMILRWDNPSPDMRPPLDEVQKDGPFRAGIRCIRRLRDHAETQDVPVIIFSALGESDAKELINADLEPVFYLQKSKVEKLINLLRAIRHGEGIIDSNESNFWAKMWESLEMKPGGFGFGIDLKKLFSRH